MGSSVGELVQTILVDQFTRLRDGDRFWYENTFAPEDVSQLKQTTLSDIIQRNTEVSNLQADVFVMSASVSGTVQGPADHRGSRPGRARGVEGVTVELLDDQGEVIDTTVTDRRGHYSFDMFTKTGDYQIQVLRPTSRGTAVETAQVLISAGGQSIRDVDFSMSPNRREEDGQGGRRRDGRQMLASRDAALEAGIPSGPMSRWQNDPGSEAPRGRRLRG